MGATDSYLIHRVIGADGTVYRADNLDQVMAALEHCRRGPIAGERGPAKLQTIRVFRREDGSDGDMEVIAEDEHSM